MIERVIAYDPGASYVGVVILTKDGGVEPYEKSPGEALDHAARYFDEHGSLEDTLVVYEQYQLYGGMQGASKRYSDMPELRFIGSLEQCIHERGPVPVKRYGASVYKAATRQWSKPPEVKGKHAGDAWRLGVWTVVFQLQWPWTVHYSDGSTVHLNRA